MIELNVSGVSPELRNSKRWVLWQLEDVQDGEKLRKNMKPPKNARTGEPAKHNNPTTWSTYEEALAAHQARIALKPSANAVKVHNVRGIGLVIGPPFFGIDLDDCRDAATGALTPEAEEWVEELNTLTEISPSGEGLHLWCHGEPPYPEGHRKDGREIYSTNRYLTVTGHVLTGRAEIRRFQKDEVKRWYDRVKAGRKAGTANKPDQAQVHSPVPANGSYTAAKIADLMTKTDGDHSQMVMSLLTLLAIEHVNNRDRIEAEFKKSALYLETDWSGSGGKWERLRASELDKACTNAAENIKKRLSKNGESVSSIEMVTDDEVVEKPLIYYWDPVLPLGKLVHFAGRSSEGKSPVTIDLISRASRGAVWPDGSPNTRGPRRSILMNIEDGMADMIVPRYYQSGGVKGRLHMLRMVTISEKETFKKAMIALGRDIGRICELARQVNRMEPPLGLIVVDPLTNYLGKLKMNGEEDMRSILTPLADLAEELQINIITVGHLNKSSEKADPLARIMGAAAFAGVARSVYLFGEDEEAPDSKYAHIMSPARGDTKTSFKYHTEIVEKDYDGLKSKIVVVKWDGTSNQSAATTANPESKKKLSLEKEAAVELKNFLKSGRRKVSDCLSFLKSGSFRIDDMNPSRIRQYAGAEYVQRDGERWWQLSSAQHDMVIPPARQDETVPKY